jgi:hypothetical protein
LRPANGVSAVAAVAAAALANNLRRVSCVMVFLPGILILLQCGVSRLNDYVVTNTKITEIFHRCLRPNHIGDGFLVR